ncbi:MAG: Crp/Fnr family transcriptional regulator, partial [Thermoanaerobaculia bacterium]
LFGEDLALAPSARHSLSARALSRSRVAYFDRQRLHELLPRDARLVARLLETLQRRNGILLEEIERVTVQSASERLVTFLSRQQTHGRPAATRLPKRILAARLAMRPETLSRILGKLKACNRLVEDDGCLFLTSSEDQDAARCALCPARLWGCPGPMLVTPRLAINQI